MCALKMTPYYRKEMKKLSSHIERNFTKQLRKCTKLISIMPCVNDKIWSDSIFRKIHQGKKLFLLLQSNLKLHNEILKKQWQ